MRIHDGPDGTSAPLPAAAEEDVTRLVHATMVRIRVFELALREEFRKMRRQSATAGGRLNAFEYGDPQAGPEMQGNLELAIGQEPVAVGIHHLKPSDYLAGTHRAHHVALAKGVRIDRLVAELLGRSTGLSRGRGGDFTLHDVSVNFESSPIVGQLLPVAAGHALAAQQTGTGAVAAVCIGDGATNQGTFHETANLAALWKLPLVILLENNGYALSVSTERSIAAFPIAACAEAYGIASSRVPDNDPLKVYGQMRDAVAHARAGHGPFLVEVVTNRMAGGFEGDRQAYRSREELEDVASRDPVQRFESFATDAGHLTVDQMRAVWREADAEVSAALHAGREAPHPDPAEAFAHVFGKSALALGGRAKSGK